MVEITRNRSATKTAFALVIASFLLSTATSLVSLHIMNEQTERDTNRALATQVYDYMNAELAGPITAARTMASNSFLVDALENEEAMGEDAFAANMANYLTSIEDGLGYNHAFVVSDSTKRYYTRKGYDRTIDPAGDEEDAWYAVFAESGAQYDLDVDNEDASSNGLAVYVNVKVADERGQLLGICGVGVLMGGMQDLFRTFEESFKVKIDLVDPQGVVQVDTNNDNIGKANLGERIAGGAAKDDYAYEDLPGGGFAVTKYMENIDWYLIVQSSGANDAGKFANVILLNVIFCLIVLIALFIALRINARRASVLENASLVDHATGLFNKRAFARDKAQFSNVPLDADLVFVTADLNGLKTVNDTLGHEAGDELIKSAADCLQSCFGKRGTVYRIGGDEFAAILHVSPDELEGLERELEQAMAAWPAKGEGGLSISCGYAAAQEFPHAGIETLSSISDERMYEAKTRYYESTGFARR